ncbi:MAG: AIPR family protein [Roseburia sp.]|nr:AIPR family protein [Roseburia sp.]
MRDLLDAKFDQFVEDFNLQDNSKEVNWRRFVNYQFFSQFQPGRLDTDSDLLDQICVDSAAFPQVQGAFFLMNDQILSEPQDIEDILQRDKKGRLELYFVTFDSAAGLAKQLEDLFRSLDEAGEGEKWLSILAYAMSREVMRRWKDNPALKVVSYGKREENKKPCFSDEFSSCFSGVDSIDIDRGRLQEIVNSNENSYQAEMEWKSEFLITGGRERFGNAYVVCVSAQELIKLMTNSDGLLRRNMFDDNVRDSQGDSAVNQEILSTLEKYPERFVLFNNGITIVCQDVNTKNGKHVLENPQIVNGCQTCNMIYQAHRKGVNLDEVRIIAKIVGSNKDDVTQGIVRGANRQNIVYEEAFETIRGFHKKLEKYFEINQVKGYRKIYYERRSRQYADNIQIKPQQKISFRGLIQSMTALFLNHVEDSHKHEYTLLKDYKDNLFIDVHSCQPYYLAAFLYLNVDALFREKKLPKELSGYKMHIMLLIKEMKGGFSPDLASADIDQYCERLLAILEDGKLKQCALEACNKFEDIRKKWVGLKGEQYKYGIKDSAEFRSFLIKEIYGASKEHDAEKLYMGYVMNVDLDKHNTLFGFIQHMPDNVFFHEFDNPNMDRTYIGKKVSYKIVRNNGQERAINVRLVE